MPLKTRDMPSVADLSEIFTLSADGRIRSKISRTSRKAGEFADNNFRSGGHRMVYAYGSHWLAHRVAFALAHGRHPVGYLDHINGNAADNRPENLRECSHTQNLYNRKLNANNSSGIKGVHHRKDNGKWRAYLTVEGKLLRFGEFETKAEATQVIREARERLHGEFAREV
jgi:hypothetical protein